MFFGITAVSTAALGWLSWQLVRQDRALAAQRAQEQREIAAGLAVAALQKHFSEAEARLNELAAYSENELAQKAEKYSRNFPIDSVLLVFNSADLKAYPASHLIYYPTLVTTPELAGEEFIKADALEFQQKDYARSIAALEASAHSANPQIRAEALVRRARNFRKGGRWQDAVSTYEQLARIENVKVHGIPADLLARGALCDVLQEHDAGVRLQHEASALYKDLQSGRWHLVRPVYDVYAEQVRRVLGSEAASVPAPETVAIAEAAQSLWREWETGRSLPPRQTHFVEDRSVLAIARPSGDRNLALLAGSAELKSWLAEVQPLAENQNARIALTDALDHPLVGPIQEQPGSYAVRLSPTTGLPWTVYAISLGPTADANAFSFRSRLVMAGLFAIALLVLGGSYLIGRAVARELAVARLQSDFVTAVSHEFRTPLTALRQLSELLAKGRVINEGVRQQYYEVLEHESARLQRLVEGLLKFGRMEAGAVRYQFETIDVAALVHSVVDEFRPEADRRGCQVVFNADSTVPPARADREALGCVIWNFLDNAVKYSPECRTVWVDLARENGCLAIRVRDQGIGIPKEDQQRIFQKFVRGEGAATLGVQGAGIGLAVAHQIIATHGGEIQLESKPGVGSTFTVLLRVVES